MSARLVPPHERGRSASCIITLKRAESEGLASAHSGRHGPWLRLLESRTSQVDQASGRRQLASCWRWYPGPLLAAGESTPLSKTEIASLGKRATALVEADRTTYGSAFCVHPSGLFITNNHVVRGAAARLN